MHGWMFMFLEVQLATYDKYGKPQPSYDCADKRREAQKEKGRQNDKVLRREMEKTNR